MLELDQAVETLRRSPDDADAWRRFFLLVWPYVVTLAHEFSSPPRNFADAEDLAQEAFLKFSRAWHAGQLRARDGAAVKALLATVTKRLAIDRDRHRRRQRRSPDAPDVSDEFNEPADLAATPERDVELAELLQVVDAQLTDQQRQILTRLLQGENREQMAGALAISPRSIERNLLKIKQLMSELLDLPG